MKFLCFLVLSLSLLVTAPFTVEAKQSHHKQATVEKKKHRDISKKERVKENKRSSLRAKSKKEARNERKSRSASRDDRRSQKEQARNRRFEKKRDLQKVAESRKERNLKKNRGRHERELKKNRSQLRALNDRKLTRKERRLLRREAALKRRSYAMSRRHFNGRYKERKKIASLDYIEPISPEKIRTSSRWMNDDSSELAGKASWYGKDFHGGKTASGLRYDMYTFTAAHRTLPLGTIVKVTTLDEGKSVMVCVTDRGPYVRGRIIDLSYAAATQLGLRKKGVGDVNLEIICDKNGKPLKKKQAFFVQYKAQKGNEKAGPFKEFADACAMQEALRQAHPDATVILDSTR